MNKQIGLKLWSINDNYILSAQKLYQDGAFDYIELYVVPGTFNKYGQMWKDLNIPVNIHAPHFMHGMNLAIEEKKEENVSLIKEIQLYSELLNSEYIVFHPGINGTINSTIAQLNTIIEQLDSGTSDKILIENMPHISLYNDVCRGATIDEIKEVLDNTSVGFCLDIGHAVKTALYFKVNYSEYLSDLGKLNPAVIHLSDGMLDSIYDQHLPIGEGEFDMAKIMSTINRFNNEYLLLETSKKSNENLDDFREDVRKIKVLL
ncbi:sugar phosphate isomerase/epimerase family protein [Candidatus Margulisiibacteriota bacterium]